MRTSHGASSTPPTQPTFNNFFPMQFKETGEDVFRSLKGCIGLLDLRHVLRALQHRVSSATGTKETLVRTVYYAPILPIVELQQHGTSAKGYFTSDLEVIPLSSAYCAMGLSAILIPSSLAASL